MVGTHSDSFCSRSPALAAGEWIVSLVGRTLPFDALGSVLTEVKNVDVM